MNLKSSVKVDVGGSVKSATDAAAKAKADVSGVVSGAAGAVADVKADVSGKVSDAVDGVKDAAGEIKGKVTGAVESAKEAASDAVSAAKAKANAAVDAAKEKAAEMKSQCKAAVDKFKGSLVAPADGWKTSFASSGSISIGKSFSMSTGISLDRGNDRYCEANVAEVSFHTRGMPRANEPYKLEVGNEVIEGITDEKGSVKIFNTADKESAKLYLGKNKEVYAISFVKPEDLSSDTEAQRNLANRDFYKGKLDGYIGPVTKAAIKKFQQYVGDTVTGELTPATLEKLKGKINGNRD